MSQLKRNAALLACVVCLLPAAARAADLNVRGTYTGNINGTPLNGSASGQVDTDGQNLSNMAIRFTSIPNDTYHPFAMGLSYVTFICGNSFAQLDADARNLWSLYRGNYSVERRFSWPDFPNSAIQATGRVVTSGTTMSYSCDMNGRYNGPTDLTGVAYYIVIWVAMDDGSIYEYGQAEITTRSGRPLTVVVESTYRGTMASRPPLLQLGIAVPDTLTYFPATPTTGAYQLSWLGFLFTL